MSNQKPTVQYSICQQNRVAMSNEVRLWYLHNGIILFVAVQTGEYFKDSSLQLRLVSIKPACSAILSNFFIIFATPGRAQRTP